jgi:hypothetical protein
LIRASNERESLRLQRLNNKNAKATAKKNSIAISVRAVSI